MEVRLKTRASEYLLPGKQVNLSDGSSAIYPALAVAEKGNTKETEFFLWEDIPNGLSYFIVSDNAVAKLERERVTGEIHIFLDNQLPYSWFILFATPEKNGALYLQIADTQPVPLKIHDREPKKPKE